MFDPSDLILIIEPYFNGREALAENLPSAASSATPPLIEASSSIVPVLDNYMIPAEDFAGSQSQGLGVVVPANNHFNILHHFAPGAAEALPSISRSGQESPATQILDPRSGRIIYKAPSPGDPVHVFEIPETPIEAADQPAENFGEVPLGGQIPDKPRFNCEKIKKEILSIDRISNQFIKAEEAFPGITQRIPPSKGLDLIMKDLIPSAQGRRGIEPGASGAEIKCYNGWLCRVARGSKIHDYCYPKDPQKRKHDIDIKDLIFLFYKKMSEKGF